MNARTLLPLPGLILFILFSVPANSQVPVIRKLPNDKPVVTTIPKDIRVRSVKDTYIEGKAETGAPQVRALRTYKQADLALKLTDNFLKLKLNRKNDEYRLPGRPRPIRIAPVNPVLTTATNFDGITDDALKLSRDPKFFSVRYNRTPEPKSSWKAFDTPGDASADTKMGVSSTHIVVTARTSIAFFDKQGNVLKDRSYIGDFFAPLKVPELTGTTGTFDTRMVFDDFRKRFWVVTLGTAPEPNKDGKKLLPVYLAVSKTENPMDGWYMYWYYHDANPEMDHDYPNIGISKNYVSISCGSNSWNSRGLNIFSAGSLASGNAKNGARYKDLKTPAGNLPDMVQPVVQHDTDDDITYLTGRDGNNIVVWKIADPLGNRVVTAKAYPVQAFTLPPAAPQKNSTKTIWFHQLGNFVVSAAGRNGCIYMVCSDAKDWFGDGDALSSVRVIKIRIKPPYSSTAVEIDHIFGSNNKLDDQPTDKMYYGFPAIDVTPEGNMVMVYSRSGKQIYPQMRASIWYNGEKDILPSRVIKEGEKEYTFTALNSWPSLPWADCSSACADPADPKSVWVATAYTNSASENNWAIWVAKISF